MLNTLSKKIDQPLKIGVTGGIGSGKSLACKIFRVLQMPVFDADSEAKKLMNNNHYIREELCTLFGNDIYLPDGLLDRKKLAQIIFNNKEDIQRVNNLVHPAVRNHFVDWYAQQKSPYIVYEAAILFESGYSVQMDYNILIRAPIEQRIEMVMKRDNTTREKVLSRINNQWPDEKKQALADFIIENDEEQFLIPQILDINKKILSIWQNLQNG
ncbi:MAG: dephospho-CoA kinase [Prolixibacteraceae bacterium]|nr:dephospho-CoA kinase [Prolixibacteraceae bacterium]